MKIRNIMAAVLLMMGTSAFAQQPLTRTTTAQGEVEGIIENGLGTFKGIPFAQPPVGDLRWKAPQAPLPYNGVYQAKQVTARAIQKISGGISTGTAAEPISEDCLYLNILTPATSKNEKLPVMLWIHGGGFQDGKSYDQWGDNLARQGLVFVSITYRMNAMGYLALPELTAESLKETGVATSGNYGMLDQIQAIKWVKENIANFGGDPDKITIQGESAGGISVSILCASPLTKGLFRGAICESGGSFSPIGEKSIVGLGCTSLQLAEQQGKDFLKKLGLDKKKLNLKELRKIPAEKFLEEGAGNCWPNADGYVITGDQYLQYERGEYNDVNLLIGTNSREGDMFSAPGTLAEYETEMNARFGEWAPKFKAMYPAKTDADVLDARSNIFRESAFAWPTYAWTNLQQKTGKSDIYVYYLDQPQANTFRPDVISKGTNHACDMAFVFGHPFSFMPFNDVDWGISKMITTYFANFVKTGNPNDDGIKEENPAHGDALPYWPVYNLEKETVMKFHNGASLVSQPNRAEVELWEEYYKDMREKLYK
ncbi:MAG: carboxylesterase family protein [Bacteroidales bacterium]|nr:carboxylesterase family protein [Bacteroidales bacterium]